MSIIRKQRMVTIVKIIAIAGLLLSALVMVMVSQLHRNAASTPVPTSTSMPVGTHATPPVPTSTSLPRGTPVAAPSSLYPPSGWFLKVDSSMNVDNTGMQWDNSLTPSSSNGLCGFKGGVYVVQAEQPNWCSSSTNLTTFALEVQMVIIGGKEGGILFYLNSSSQTYYSFHITTDGHCTVTRSDGVDNVSPPYVIDCRAALKIGQNQPNVLAVLANGKNINLYVNRQRVMVIPNNVMNTLSGTSYQHGAVGFDVNSYTDGEQVPTEIHYSNLKLWQPSLMQSL